MRVQETDWGYIEWMEPEYPGMGSEEASLRTVGRCYNANINKYLKEEQGYEKESNRSASGYGNGIWLGCMWKQCRSEEHTSELQSQR